MIRYLSINDISLLAPSWKIMVEVIEETLTILALKDFEQPIKPYLRFRDPKNRIIAMPAFVGGKFNAVGIKWIASFPENIKKNIPRASSLTVLNDYETGMPTGILSSNQLSGLRTAAVSGFVINKMRGLLPSESLKIGILGFGPIGQLHAKMVSEILKDQIEEINVYDINSQPHSVNFPNIKFTSSWEETYLDADIVICCTTSPKRYIDKLPKPGSLHLNVSLRDYFPDIVMQSSVVLVDNWEEVCRENTDIEQCAVQFGLNKEQIISLPELKCDSLSNLLKKRTLNPMSNGYISFHPMGLAVFDIVLSQFIFELAEKAQAGSLLSL